MQKIKWGVIGPGSIATGFAHSIKYCQNSELTSVFGRNEKKAKRRKKLEKYESKKLKEIRSGKVGYSKGGIVDRQYLKGR